MILVVGGAGYIGSHFVKHFVLHQQKIHDESPVIVLDNFSYGHKEALSHIPQVQIIEGDTGDSQLLNEIFTKHSITAVVHFAADAYVGESQELPFKYFNNNVVKTLNLFECMENFGIRRIVFSSSCATYGVPNYNPLDEQHQQKPVNV